MHPRRPCPPHNATPALLPNIPSSTWGKQILSSSTYCFLRPLTHLVTTHILLSVRLLPLPMALETCFRAWALHAAAPAGAKDRLLAGGSSSSFAPSKRAAAVPLWVGRVATRRPRHVCQSKNAVDEVLVADEKNWDGMVIACETPVLVEFWAPWCGPCRMIAPVIDELAKDYAGKIKCCKVNTDDCPNVASTYGIRSIPTVLIFKAGEKKESVIGAVPKSTLTGLIDKYIGSS